MTIQLTWKTLPRLAAIHLAYCGWKYPEAVRLTNSDQAQRAYSLWGVCKSMPIAPMRVWDWLFQLAPDAQSSGELVERLCVRCLSQAERSPELLSRLQAGLLDCERLLGILHPNFESEMKLRQGPLKEQWEAYGPGLLYQISQAIGPELLVDAAQVYLVTPVMSGLGWAHLNTNRCHLEAVLTNQHAQLSEVMRLAWLLAQLGFERPIYSERIRADRLRLVAGLSTLPATLWAAEQLGIGQLNAVSLLEALQHWRIDTPARSPVQLEALAQVLLVWWETFSSGRTDWSVALTGLDRMISTEGE